MKRKIMVLKKIQLKTIQFLGRSSLIAMLLSILIIGVGILFHNGTKEGYGSYFLVAATISPFLTALSFRKSFWKDFGLGLVVTIVIVVLAETFWNYQDKPWFSPPEMHNCDGPCYGWFSFENRLPFFEILLTGITGSFLGSLIPRKKLLIIISVVLISILFLQTVFSLRKATTNSTLEKSYAAVLLGGQNEGETSISSAQQECANKAIELYRAGIIKKVVVGGYRFEYVNTSKNKYESINKSVVKDYLITSDIPEENIEVLTGWDPRYGGSIYGMIAQINTQALDEKFNSIILIGHTSEVAEARAIVAGYPVFTKVYSLSTGNSATDNLVIDIVGTVIKQDIYFLTQTIGTVTLFIAGIVSIGWRLVSPS